AIDVPSGDHAGCRASLKTSVMRVAAPPDEGSVQMLPCRSMASVRPSGETATDIEVPSLTVTLSGAGAGAAPSALRKTTMRIRQLARDMRPPAVAAFYPSAAAAAIKRSSEIV